ncbi:MAG: universal stress protein [Chloroflexi bacterium]|nr:universal stress protein [Chloroflexota bacterium]
MPIRRILLGYDGSESARRAAEVAGELARALGAAVTVLEVGQAIIPTGQGVLPAIEEEPHRALAEEGRRLVAERGAAAEAAFRWGDPASEIVAASRELGADLIVVGHGRKRRLQAFVLGSVAQAIVERAACPVLVAR